MQKREKIAKFVYDKCVLNGIYLFLKSNLCYKMDYRSIALNKNN